MAVFNLIIKTAVRLCVIQSKGGKLVTAAFQRFPLFFQSSHQLSETFDTRAMRTANPLRMFLTPKVFLCVDSFIRVQSDFSLHRFFGAGLMGADAAPVCLLMVLPNVTRSQCFSFGIPRPANVMKHTEG